MRSINTHRGKKYGMLKLLGDYQRSPSGKIQLLCECDCGNVKFMRFDSIKIGRVVSCGCYNGATRNNNLTRNKIRHGYSKGTAGKCSPTYSSWLSMKQRVKRDPHYANVTIDSEWFKFENFLADMGDRPDDHTLDRINNSLGYTKSNCRWAKSNVQAMNRSFKINESSGFYGVNKRSSGRYTVSITYNKVHYHLGTHDNAEDAANVYDAKLFELCGISFPTKFNFPHKYM